MAAQKDLLSRLAEAGEEAIQRFPGGDNLAKALNSSRDRLDELQKRVRGIERLEKRVAALEKRLDALSKPAKPSAKKPAARKKPPARKPPEASNPPA